MSLLMTHCGSQTFGGGGGTNRLLYENSDAILLENSSGDLALE